MGKNTFKSRHFSVALVAAALFGVALVGAGCKDMMGKPDDSKKMETSSKTLYERLGGEPAITAVVDDFVPRAASDKAVNFTREGHPNHWDATPANVEKLKKHLIQFISMATGGPKTYEGKDMATAHTGMGITESEWTAIVADLEASLDKLKVPAKEHAELIAVVATTHNDIVGK